MDVLGDSAIAQRASETGRQHREFYRRADALAVFEHTSRRLLDL
jgi:hypothetical protein